MSQKLENSITSIVEWQADAAYNQLPVLPPVIDLESKTVLKRCITARAALAELKQAAELIPNQGMLINTLPLLEARASSEIENIVTTTDRLVSVLGRQTTRGGPRQPKEAFALWARADLYGFLTNCQDHPLTTLYSGEGVYLGSKALEMHVRRVPGTALANDKTGEITLHAAGGWGITAAGSAHELGAFSAWGTRSGPCWYEWQWRIINSRRSIRSPTAMGGQVES